MRIANRRPAIIFSLTLGICLAGFAVAVGGGWIILNWQEGIKVFLGVIFFGAITTGIILNTSFLIHEIRRNEQHDSFINAVTHELKTPIASIRLYLQTLQRRDVDETQRREFYQLMLEDSERLLGTVEQVLRAGEASHKQLARHEPVDYVGLVRECVEIARLRHHLGSEALRYDPAMKDGASILGNPDELRAAVSNLLENAIKYSDGQVDISVRLESAEKDRVVLSVQDHGVGIPVHELKRIFNRFYRVSHRSVAKVKGTGLGLFIVKTIAQKHGGRVFAESEGEGHGTTVVLDLPRRLV